MIDLKSGFRGKVEFAQKLRPRRIDCVLFDFDGTLSLIRQGWHEVMLPMFVEMLPRAKGISKSQDEQMLFEDIMQLNGKQTIYQMLRLSERIAERGGNPKTPLWYKHEYLRRLDQRIQSRLQRIQKGLCHKDAFVLFGARDFLESLKSLGCPLYLASGTDEPFVKHEAELLGIADYFDGRIFGARDDYKSFSKKKVIENILRSGIAAEHLVAFGDGYVEIENTKAVGGLAVAMASDEARNGSGNFDEWKRARLLRAGADIILPDYRDADHLIKIISTT